jgi:hypothetical protein
MLLIHTGSNATRLLNMFRGLMRPGREADHLPQIVAEVKNAWSYTSVSPYSFVVYKGTTFTFRLNLRVNYS